MTRRRGRRRRDVMTRRRRRRRRDDYGTRRGRRRKRDRAIAGTVTMAATRRLEVERLQIATGALATVANDHLIPDGSGGRGQRRMMMGGSNRHSAEHDCRGHSEFEFIIHTFIIPKSAPLRKRILHRTGTRYSASFLRFNILGGARARLSRVINAELEFFQKIPCDGLTYFPIILGKIISSQPLLF